MWIDNHPVFFCMQRPYLLVISIEHFREPLVPPLTVFAYVHCQLPGTPSFIQLACAHPFGPQRDAALYPPLFWPYSNPHCTLREAVATYIHLSSILQSRFYCFRCASCARQQL